MSRPTEDATLRPPPQAPTARGVVVSSVYPDTEAAAQIGQQAYSYYFVYQAFKPLLERWGATADIDRPESRLDHALWRARRQGLEPLHLSFLPLHATYLSAHAPNVAFPFWEFPDLPDTPLGHNPRNNWSWVAGRASLVLTACDFTRRAFRRAGVRTPVRVVPVPVRPAYFDVPPWRPGQRVVLDGPCHVLPEPPAAGPAAPDPWQSPVRPGLRGLHDRLRRGYKGSIRPRLPNLVRAGIDLTGKLVKKARELTRDHPPPPEPTARRVELTGVVFTTVLNPFDPRKNWQDLLSAFLVALGDREDATLVIKLVVGRELAGLALHGLLGHYRGLGLRHRCRVVLVPDYLSDEQMVGLARGSTYYVNTSHAEGCCLPLQDFLAAGRPGIAPAHTALADYFDDAVGFRIDSHPEPASFPHDPEQRLATTWHRLVWQSLHDQLRAAYAAARGEPDRYQDLAAGGRSRMEQHASLEAVWPRLAAALDAAADEASRDGRQTPAASR